MPIATKQIGHYDTPSLAFLFGGDEEILVVQTQLTAIRVQYDFHKNQIKKDIGLFRNSATIVGFPV